MYHTKISVLIPTLGQRERALTRLLKSLAAQSSQNFEAVIVSQEHYERVEFICKKYENLMNITHIRAVKKGLSAARNAGLKYITEGIVLLSDDDCWYASDALERVEKYYKRCHFDILLTQIYDPYHDRPYKLYSTKAMKITSWFQLMSRSSIEIAFNRESCHSCFDENMGLGSRFISGEEVDFLLNNSEKNIIYVPRVTVYHPRKRVRQPEGRAAAKGYLYGKHFNTVTGICVCIRDLMVRRCYVVPFFKGFCFAKRRKEDI